MPEYTFELLGHVEVLYFKILHQFKPEVTCTLLLRVTRCEGEKKNIIGIELMASSLNNYGLIFTCVKVLRIFNRPTGQIWRERNLYKGPSINYVTRKGRGGGGGGGLSQREDAYIKYTISMG